MRRAKSGDPNSGEPKSDDSHEIDEMIQELGDWRGSKLSRLRTLITEAVPGVVEELKWRKSVEPTRCPDLVSQRSDLYG